MKKILYIILFSLITLAIFSCAGEEPFYSDPFTDTTAPFIEEVTFVTTPTNDSTPDYTFSSDEAGTITYGGSCSSSTTSAVEGNNTITLVSLNEGTYSDCTITVTDEAGNISIKLTITSFIVDTTVPVISGSTITTPTNDSTPNYTFSSDEAGTITYGGSCSSANKSAISGNNIITLNSLSDGTYSNCTLTVTDSAGNSVTLNITSFTVAIPPTIEEVTFVTTPTNDSTPDYTFSSDEAGTITYGGSCSSTTTSAIVGNNTITLVSLSEGTYSDCTITVTDSAGNASSALSASTFVVDTTAPSVSSFTLSDTALITGDTATVTLVFSEAVASFSSAADITVANGTLATMTSADNITWAGTFTPTANTEDDNNTLLLATSYTDTAGNAGYVEDFVDKNCDAGIALNSSCTNWEGSEAWTHSGSGIYVGPHVNLQPAGYDTPDGDDYYVQNYTGQSISKFAITKAGEYTITGPVDLTCDWASSTNLGMRILAEVGGVWYGSTQIGTGSNDHGAMDQDKVTDWEVNVSINTASGTWYQATGLPNGYDWRDGNRFSTTPLTGLPAGDITRFGIGWLHTANHHYGAVDNFRPLATTLNYAVETLAPTVSSVSTTADNQSLISITDNITVTFSEAMGTSYITTTTSDTTCRAETIKVSSDNFSTCVRMSSEPVSSNDNKKFTLDPYDNLTVGTTYKTRVTTGVKDTAGNALSSQYETSSGFTTSSSSSSSSATTITLGPNHTCMLDNGTVKCWGYNYWGQLGIDNYTNMGDNSSEMAQLTGINLGTGRTATAISAGYHHNYI
ncbi:MAG: Ig-like domain-containing protein, partial [SAR324 cluster bacterium]|nr:Ig-like domain-containing protein [SAR324 cluster bacterium]